MSRARTLVARVLAHPRCIVVALAVVALVAPTALAMRHRSSPFAGDATDAIGAAREASPQTSIAPTTVAPTTTPATTAPTTLPPTTLPTTTVPPPVTAPPEPAPPPPPPAPQPQPTAAPDAAAPSAPTAPAEPPATAPPAPSGTRCLVRLHGKGGNGGPTYVDGDVTVLEPAGNAAGWGGLQWVYFPQRAYADALAPIARAVDGAGCGQVIVDGFSNGAAFAVKLYCRGESFDGRLVRVVADDPVPDHGADGCAPAPGVALTLYWTGALDATAQPGWDCTQQDWTCEGGVTIGIGAYAANAGAGVQKSPYDGHEWYLDAPELSSWR
jgi:hypothetical protein